MSNIKIEILGERKTGTNYIKKMLQEHYSNIDYVNHGWKHRLIELDKLPEDTIYVICSKDPYLWLQSLYDKPYHMLASKKEGFSKFLTHQARDYSNKSKPRTYTNPMRMWNQKYMRYKNLLESDHKTYLIRHEDIVTYYRKVFMKLQKEHNLLCVKKLVNIKNHISDLGIQPFKFNPKKYGAITHGDRQVIKQNLNNNLLKYYNYQ